MPSPHQLSRRRRRRAVTEQPGDGTDRAPAVPTATPSQTRRIGTPPRRTTRGTASAADRPAASSVSSEPVSSKPVSSKPVSSEPVSSRPVSFKAAASRAAVSRAASRDEAGGRSLERDDPGTPAGRRAWVLPAALGVVTVILGGLAVWSATAAHELRADAAARNLALTDNARTSEVNGQITSAVNTLFSYSYADVAKSEQAARKLLTGKAVRQYEEMFRPVREQAPKDKPVLTTTVTDSGVVMLQGDRARVLIFADQRSTRTSDDQTSYAGAMLAVDVVREGGTWKIGNIDTLNVPR